MGKGRCRRSRTWLIDGFNTLHADPDLARLLQREGPVPACQALERLCHAWVVARLRTDVVLIFDGRRAAGAPVPTGRQPGVTVDLTAAGPGERPVTIRGTVSGEGPQAAYTFDVTGDRLAIDGTTGF